MGERPRTLESGLKNWHEGSPVVASYIHLSGCVESATANIVTDEKRSIRAMSSLLDSDLSLHSPSTSVPSRRADACVSPGPVQQFVQQNFEIRHDPCSYVAGCCSREMAEFRQKSTFSGLYRTAASPPFPVFGTECRGSESLYPRQCFAWLFTG